MALLGSDYAKSKIPEMDFYNGSNAEAIDQALGELAVETAAFDESDWQSNVYMSWLWTINGLFNWSEEHADELPTFMQNSSWAVKTLQTASAWWTQLRHATVLYAKQSFAELGGGPEEGCNNRELKETPKGYIEPNLLAFDRLDYLARRLNVGLTEQNFVLNNMGPLETFISLLDLVRPYISQELLNTELSEVVGVTTFPDPEDSSKTCVEYAIRDNESDWEVLRVDITDRLLWSTPIPTEGPLFMAKDKRSSLVADVHTGGDLFNDTSILYEGTGVPYVIFTAVKDVNGPRLTIGFVSAHYEFRKDYGGQRLTDEDWQENFYHTTDQGGWAFSYTDKNTWPTRNTWYDPLF